MIYAFVVTEWIGDGLSRATAYRPRLLVDYPQDQYHYRYDDVTQQEAANLTPEPNMFMMGIECDADFLALLDADPNYQVFIDE